MSVWNHALHNATLQFVHHNGYYAPQDWKVTLTVDASVNDAFVLLPKTIDPWKTGVTFTPDTPENRNWLRFVREDNGKRIFEGTIKVADVNALDMSKRLVVGFNGGFDWAQAFGESVRAAMVYGRGD